MLIGLVLEGFVDKDVNGLLNGPLNGLADQDSNGLLKGARLGLLKGELLKLKLGAKLGLDDRLDNGAKLGLLENGSNDNNPKESSEVPKE